MLKGDGKELDVRIRLFFSGLSANRALNRLVLICKPFPTLSEQRVCFIFFGHGPG